MPDANVSYVCSGTVGVSRFVKQGGSPFRAAEAGSAPADALLGISQEGCLESPGLSGTNVGVAGTDGKMIKVYGQGDHCVLVAGATISAGNFLKSDANSFGTPITLTATAAPEWYGARALEHCLSGGLVRVQVDIGSYLDN